MAGQAGHDGRIIGYELRTLVIMSKNGPAALMQKVVFHASVEPDVQRAKTGNPVQGGTVTLLREAAILDGAGGIMRSGRVRIGGGCFFSCRRIGMCIRL